jgi:hypothetical protein
MSFEAWRGAPGTRLAPVMTTPLGLVETGGGCR